MPKRQNTAIEKNIEYKFIGANVQPWLSEEENRHFNIMNSHAC